jgi:outer membrane protein assembly factor BamB
MPIIVPVMPAALLIALLGCGGTTIAVDPLATETAIKPAADGDAKPVGTHSWPMLGGTPARNMVNTAEKGLPTEWSVKKGKEQNIKWVANLGTQAWGGPVVSGGKIFVGTNNDPPRNPKIKDDRGILMCFRESDGAFLWQAVHDKLPGGEAGGDYPDQGIASTPAVEGNRIYYVSNRCELVCASTEAKKGTTEADILWTLDMFEELKVYPHQLAASSPVIGGNLVFVLTGNGVAPLAAGETKYTLPSPKAPSFIAVDKNTGKLAWKDDSPGDRILQGQWGSPAYAEIDGKPQVIFPGGDGWLYSFEPKTGKPIWKFNCNLKSSVFEISGSPRSTRGYLSSTPVVHDNKVYIGIDAGAENLIGVGHFWCIDATKTGDLSPVDDNLDPKAAVNKNSGLVWHFGGRILPAPEDGREWYFGRTLGSAAIQDGLLYIADGDGFVFCLDAQTGEKFWEHDLLTNIMDSPYVVDGKVYVTTTDGTVYVFAQGKEKKLLAKNKTGQDARTPVAVNGVLYVQTKEKLYAIAAK